MGTYLLHILLLLPIIQLIHEDFRLRQVGIIWLCSVGILSLCITTISRSFTYAIIQSTINILILALLCSAICTYLYFRKPNKNQLSHYIGSGDIFFMAAITALFSPRDYILFLNTSFITALLGNIIIHWKTIPLIGIMGIILILFIISKFSGLWN